MNHENTPHQIVDSLELAEAMKESYQEHLNNGLPGMGGIVRAINPETGKPILKKNIFVQRGRTFTLEKLFGEAVPTEHYPLQNLNRTINLFRAGSGGAPANDPFSPVAPSPLDTDLSVPEPFRIVDPDDPNTALTPEEVGKYHQPQTVDGKTHYFAKTFDATPTWVVNKADNKIYRSIQLSIEMKDLRDRKINEIGLCISTDDHNDIELFSRWTTETIAFRDSMAMVFEYLVYA